MKDQARTAHKFVIWFLTLAFAMADVLSYAQVLSLADQGLRVSNSPLIEGPLLKGIKVNSKDTFKLDFILDKGKGGIVERKASERLVKYFLAGLTVPEEDLWVNLSPYERDRIVPDAFGVTEMGRDLLAQDYLLKQLTASLIYPEGESGKKFWAKVYEQAHKRFGTSNIPMEAFNKVWIMPSKAEVYETPHGAYVLESRLKVMLDSDYLATAKSSMSTGGHVVAAGDNVSPEQVLTRDIIREIVIPLLEQEVNEGADFERLRQVYNSLILALWFKDRMKESVLGQAYADRRKTGGIEITDKTEKEKIWAQYVESFRKGVYNLVQEETDAQTGEVIPRKYFSGGVVLMPKVDGILQVNHDAAQLAVSNAIISNIVHVVLVPTKGVRTDISIVAEKDEGGFSSVELRRFKDIIKFASEHPLKKEMKKEQKRPLQLDIAKRIAALTRQDMVLFDMKQSERLAIKVDLPGRLGTLLKLAQWRYDGVEYVFSGPALFMITALVAVESEDVLFDRIRWLIKQTEPDGKGRLFSGMQIAKILYSGKSWEEKVRLIDLFRADYKGFYIANMIQSSGGSREQDLFAGWLRERKHMESSVCLFNQNQISMIMHLGDPRAELEHIIEELMKVRSDDGKPFYSGLDIVRIVVLRDSAAHKLEYCAELKRQGFSGSEIGRILHQPGVVADKKQVLDWLRMQKDHLTARQLFSRSDLVMVMEGADSLEEKRMFVEWQEAELRDGRPHQVFDSRLLAGVLLGRGHFKRSPEKASGTLMHSLLSSGYFAERLSMEEWLSRKKDMAGVGGLFNQRELALIAGHESRREDKVALVNFLRERHFSGSTIARIVCAPGSRDSKESMISRLMRPDILREGALMDRVEADIAAILEFEKDTEYKKSVIEYLSSVPSGSGMREGSFDLHQISRMLLSGGPLSFYKSLVGWMAKRKEIDGVTPLFSAEDITRVIGDNPVAPSDAERPRRVLERRIAAAVGLLKRDGVNVFSKDQSSRLSSKFDILDRTALLYPLFFLKGSDNSYYFSVDDIFNIMEVTADNIANLKQVVTELMVLKREGDPDSLLSPSQVSSIVRTGGRLMEKVEQVKEFYLLKTRDADKFMFTGHDMYYLARSGWTSEQKRTVISLLSAQDDRDRRPLFTSEQIVRVVSKKSEYADVKSLIDHMLTEKDNDQHGYFFNGSAIAEIIYAPGNCGDKIGLIGKLRRKGFNAVQIARVIRAGGTSDVKMSLIEFLLTEKWRNGEAAFTHQDVAVIVSVHSHHEKGDNVDIGLLLGWLKEARSTNGSYWLFERERAAQLMRGRGNWAELRAMAVRLRDMGFTGSQIGKIAAGPWPGQAKADLAAKMLSFQVKGGEQPLMNHRDIVTVLRNMHHFDADRFGKLWDATKDSGIQYWTLLRFMLDAEFARSFFSLWLEKDPSAWPDVMLRKRLSLLRNTRVGMKELLLLAGESLPLEMVTHLGQAITGSIREDQRILKEVLSGSHDRNSILRLLTSADPQVRAQAGKWILIQMDKPYKLYQRAGDEVIDAFHEYIDHYDWVSSAASLSSLRKNLFDLLPFARPYLFWTTMPSEMRAVLRFARQMERNRQNVNDIYQYSKGRYSWHDYQSARANAYGGISLDTGGDDDRDLYNLFGKELMSEEYSLWLDDAVSSEEMYSPVKDGIGPEALVIIDFPGRQQSVVKANNLQEALLQYWDKVGEERSRVRSMVQRGVRVLLNHEEIDLYGEMELPLEGVNSLSISEIFDQAQESESLGKEQVKNKGGIDLTRLLIERAGVLGVDARASVGAGLWKGLDHVTGFRPVIMSSRALAVTVKMFLGD